MANLPGQDGLGEYVEVPILCLNDHSQRNKALTEMPFPNVLCSASEYPKLGNGGEGRE